MEEKYNPKCHYICTVARFGTVARSVRLFRCRWCFGFLWFFWLFLKSNRLSLILNILMLGNFLRLVWIA